MNLKIKKYIVYIYIMIQKNDIIVYNNKINNNNNFIFYVVINITNLNLIVREIKKNINYILDENERIYKKVNINLNDDNYIILKNLLYPKRIYLKNIDLNKYEKYNNNNNYIENI